MGYPIHAAAFQMPFSIGFSRIACFKNIFKIYIYTMHRPEKRNIRDREKERQIALKLKLSLYYIVGIIII